MEEDIVQQGNRERKAKPYDCIARYSLKRLATLSPQTRRLHLCANHWNGFHGDLCLHWTSSGPEKLQPKNLWRPFLRALFNIL